MEVLTKAISGDLVYSPAGVSNFSSFKLKLTSETTLRFYITERNMVFPFDQPHSEKSVKRVRVLFGQEWIVDTKKASLV